MSDQLEAEVQETVELDTETVDLQTDQTSETVSDTGENQENKPTFTPEQKATADYAFKMREAKREAEDLRQQLAKAQQPAGDNFRPNVPELPEFPDSEELAVWQKATTDALVWDNQQKSQQDAAYTAQVTAQNQQIESQAKLDNDFVATSTQAGIKFDDLNLANNIVQNSGIDPVIQQAMKMDKDGGMMYLHLATNPESMQAMLGANLLTIGTVYADIKAKAATLKPKQSETPSPAEILDGNGAPPKQGGPPGVTYE